MIISQISGGLGNQLFQYAAGRCLAHKLNTELKLDLSYYKNEDKSVVSFYQLDKFNVQENFATPEEIAKCTVAHQKDTRTGLGGFLPKIFDYPDNTYIEGLIMSEKYFVDIKDIIRREFTLKKPLSKNSAAWRDKILASNCAVCVHIRHGDYLSPRNIIHGILPFNYYTRALKRLKEECGDISIFIFSDDLQWCKDNLKFDVPTEFVEGCEHSYEEMYLMSLCKHNILANSTFSWWGAWLNKNPDKKVFVPNPWLYCLYWEDIVPDGWIKIPVDYSASTPKILSLIVYLQDDMSTVNLALTSLLAPNRLDYEIILVDASTDGTGQFCRQVAADKRITILRIDPSLDKFTAWQKGLDVARGNYVMFLTGKDIIFPQAAAVLADICDISLKRYANTFETYMAYGTYVNCTPNIICSTQNFSVANGDNIDINAIPNKTFSIQIDAEFKGLKGITELNLTAEQKLMLLATKGINNFVGTKFFKRQFLIDNKIAFKEPAGGVRMQNYSSWSMHFWRRKKLFSCRKFLVGSLSNLR